MYMYNVQYLYLLIFKHYVRPFTFLSLVRDARNDSLLNMGKSSTLLAQVFSLLIRQLTETLDNIYEVVNCPTPPYVLPALATDPADLYKFVWAELEEVWVWLFNSMDMLESQLRFGSSMSRKVLCTVGGERGGGGREEGGRKRGGGEREGRKREYIHVCEH